MRKVLLLAALCMALAFTLSAPAMAQGVSPEAGTGNPYGCPDEAPFVATAPGDPGEGSLRCFATQAEADAYSSGEAASPSASARASASASASASAEPVSCEEFVALASGEFSQYQAQQFFDFVATPEQQAALDPDGNGFACDNGEIEFGGDDASASASASASATASVSALPETGGPVSVTALVPLVLLVGTGIVAFGIVRRN